MEARGIPLDEFTKGCPPGWSPHLVQYPLKLYREKLRLWLRTTDVAEEAVGPTIVGRLKGAAYRLALKVRVPRQDGRTLVGDEALCALREPAQYDPTTGAELLPGTQSGLQKFLELLEESFGEEEQDVQAASLDRFFNLWRGNSSLLEYCTAFKMRCETAEEKAGLHINPTGLTHLLLTHAGLSPKYLDDIYLKVDGDRSQFARIFSIFQRTARQHVGVADETMGHILLAEPDEEESPSPAIDYFTDANGAWYIWDYDLGAGYYIDVAQEEQQLWANEAYLFWDGAETDQDYDAWNAAWEEGDDNETADADEDYYSPLQDLDGTDALLGRKGKGKFRRRKGKGNGKGKSFKGLGKGKGKCKFQEKGKGGKKGK